MPRLRDSRRRCAGFTLIEVLVALAIVGLALGAVAEVFAVARQGQVMATDVDGAVGVADRQLALAAMTDPPRLGLSRGTAGRFVWRLSVAPFHDSADAGRPAPPLYRITVTVGWAGDRGSRQVTLSTLRLAAAAR